MPPAAEIQPANCLITSLEAVTERDPSCDPGVQTSRGSTGSASWTVHTPPVSCPMTELGSPNFSLNDVPETARTAWTRLGDALQSILGDDLVAIWAYGSVIGSDRPQRPADLDTHVIVRRRPNAATAQSIVRASEAIAAELAVNGTPGTSCSRIPGSRSTRPMRFATAGVIRPGRYIEHTGSPGAS